MKKTWQSPKLIVLVRSRPEESVLSFCKGIQGPTVGPNTAWWYCTLVDAECPYCSVEVPS